MKRTLSVLAALVILGGVFTACLPSGDTSLTPPVRAAFWYPWYPNAWNQQGLNPFTHYNPTAGFYASADAATISRQIADMQYANLDAGIVSWWGQGSQEDSAMPSIMSGANGTGFKVSAYYEPEGTGDPSVTQIESDLAYLKAHYANSPNWLYINNLPVLFVYGDGSDGCGMASRWSQANASSSGGFYTILKVFPGYASCADQPSQWHQYGPASATDEQAGHSFSVSPGFWKANEATPRLPRTLLTFDANLQKMVNSNEPLQLLTSWNEYGEGTQLESTSACITPGGGLQQAGTTDSACNWSSASGHGQYVDAMHAIIPARGTTTTTTTTVPPTTTTSTPPTTTTSTSVPPTTTTTTTVPPTTTTTTRPQTSGHKVMVVMEENHSASQVTASSMPYLVGLGTTFGKATDYAALSHPSLPNYLEIFGGTNYGTSTDCSVGCGPTASTARSVWDQTIAAGESAKAYQQSMPSNCATGGSGAYAPRHGPWPYWTNATSRSNCSVNDVPLTALQADISAGHLPVTGEITPDLNNDAHDGTLGQADTFLKSWVPALMAGPDYKAGNLTIIIVFDENDGASGNIVTFVAVDPRLSGKTVTSAANHYSLAKWLDDNAGVAEQNNAGGAANLKAAFGL